MEIDSTRGWHPPACRILYRVCSQDFVLLSIREGLVGIYDGISIRVDAKL